MPPSYCEAKFSLILNAYEHAVSTAPEAESYKERVAGVGLVALKS
jgi:hypothetical protein